MIISAVLVIKHGFSCINYLTACQVKSRLLMNLQTVLDPDKDQSFEESEDIPERFY